MKHLSKILSLCSVLFFLHGLHGQETYLNPLWELAVGDEPFLTTGNTERGLAYNPATNHVLVASRAPATAVHVLDADTGAVVGELSMAGVSGGTFLLNKVAVTEDGTIYAGNLTLDSGGDSAYRLYRWENEAADPVAVFVGDPSQGDANSGNRRFGDSLAVRGTGPDTEILLSTWAGSLLSYLTPDGKGGFAAEAIPAPFPAGDVRTLHFAEGNLVYGSHSGTPLYELSFDPATKTIEIVRSFNGAIISSDMAPVAVNTGANLLASVRTGAHAVVLYDRAHLTTEWTVVPIASRAFPTSNPNGNGVGAIAFAGNRIFALDTNNGILALEVSDQPPPVEPVVPGDIYWTNATEVRTAEIDGSDPRTVLGGLTRAIGIAIDPNRHHAYYADDSAGVIGRVNLDGTAHVEILTGLTNPQFLKVHNDKLYWAQWTAGLFSANLDGSEVEQLIDLGSTGQSTAVVIGGDGTVYLGSAAGNLYRPTGDPAAPEQVVSLASATYGLALDSDTGTLYATSFGSGTIYSVDLSTGGETWLNSGTQPLGIDLTRDRSQLVWAERSGGAIKIASIASGATASTLLSGEDSPFGLVVVPELAELPAGFAEWIGQFDLPVEQAGAQDDPDGDGIENLLEYALGGDPAVAGSAPAPASGFESAGEEDYLALAITKNPDATGVILVVEVSPDLVNWGSGEGETVVVEETATTLIVRDAIPMSSETKRFIRLRVKQE